MAKKKPVQSFAKENITFELDRTCFKLLQFNPNSMEVTIQSVESKTQQILPFAHLPKPVKKIVRPLH